ncbi:fasciclin domain-containing protein [Hymenobacter rubidus]|uniref:fasciclin domain-containing protein n=1 Tax=Hymenobacter rubidus TaxID=1441626 RepID=UPI00191CF400|nr:fasciclin domain-containing protein [Hymenobacter rubidus]
MKKKYLFKSGFLALSLLVLGACAKNKEVDPSITNIAVSNPDFQLLEDAAIRGGVAVTLGNKNPNDPQGNYTVFAPNNAAFNRLGIREAADLTALQPTFLTNTLLYHVFSGSLAGSALTPGSASASASVAAAGSTRRIIRRADGSLYVNGSKILGTDVKAANGLIHPIDKVLIATGGNIVQSAQALQMAQVFTNPELTFLVEAVVYSGLATTLSGPGPFTVFAPTDQAFKDFLKSKNLKADVPADLHQLTPQAVQAVLLGHALSGGKFTPELPESTTVAAAGGTSLTLGAFTNGLLTVKYGASNSSATPANMVIPDVQCTNGVVHVIDRVLAP